MSLKEVFTEQIKMSEDLKYTFEEVSVWAGKESEPKNTGKNILYVFGGIVVLFLVLAVLALFLCSPPEERKPKKGDSVSFSSDSDSTSSITEHDVLEDIKKAEKSIKAK